MNKDRLCPLTVYELEQQWKAGSSPFLLDVRTAAEVAVCRLPGAVWIAQPDVPFQLDRLPDDDDIVIYCHHGIRSQAVGYYLISQGWQPDRLFNLEGGIDAFARYLDPSMARY